MSDVQLQKAAALIRQKNYKDARALLMTIDHPTSIEWLERLESIEADNRRRRNRGCVIAFAIVFLGIVVVGGYYAVELAPKLATMSNCIQRFIYDQDLMDACYIEGGLEPPARATPSASP